MKALRALALCALLGGAAAAGEGMAPAAKALYVHGMQLYQAGRFAEAAAELRAGQALDPRPEFLYALGQCERNLKHCERAREYYRAFLATASPEEQKRLAQVQIERCDQELIGESATPPAPSPSPSPSPSPPPSPSPSPPPSPVPSPAAAVSARRAWSRDPAAGVLTGLGAAGLVAGAALLGHASAVIDDARHSYDDYVAARGERGEQIAGAVTLSVGAALCIGGAIRFALARRAARRGAP